MMSKEDTREWALHHLPVMAACLQLLCSQGPIFPNRTDDAICHPQMVTSTVLVSREQNHFFVEEDYCRKPSGAALDGSEQKPVLLVTLCVFCLQPCARRPVWTEADASGPTGVTALQGGADTTAPGDCKHTPPCSSTVHSFTTFHVSSMC